MQVATTTVLAILLLAFCVVCSRTPPPPRSSRRHHKHERNDPNRSGGGGRNEPAARKREELFLRLQGRPVECCRTVTTVVEPEFGKSRTGMALELHRGPNTTQQFEEISCAKNVAGQPCRFVDRHLRQYSRCVQQHSFTYALVRDADTQQNFRLDYISIRSGCSCQIIPPDAPP